MTGAPAQVHLLGCSLASLALAARLARHGHAVTVIADGPAGGRAAPLELADQPGVTVDQLPPVTTLPAAWRDLATKSGRPMAGFLNAAHLSLVEAPAALHRFPDGSELPLPADRGGQTTALQHLVGRSQALAWAGLLDTMDEVWQALRRHGIESPHEPDQPAPAGLLPHQAMGDLADRLPDARLRMLWLSAASRAGSSSPSTAPALLGSRWSMERTFGRWQLLDQDTSLSQPLSQLTTLLLGRLDQAGVQVVPAPSPNGGVDDPTQQDRWPIADVVVDCRPPTPPPRRWTWRRPLDRGHLRAVPPPRVQHTLVAAGAYHDGHLLEVVDHHGDGHPVVTWTRRVDADTAVETVHDHRSPGDLDPRWGWTIDSFQQWVDRPPLHARGRRPDGAGWQVSAASHAGNEPWAELLGAALVSYEVHEQLTGADIRPTNRTPPPRPPRGHPKRPHSER